MYMIEGLKRYICEIKTSQTEKLTDEALVTPSKTSRKANRAREDEADNNYIYIYKTNF